MRTSPTLVQLRALVAVIDAGSFTDAAERLGVTQSTVSQTIGVLEDLLGIVLLVRGRDGVALTAACTALLPDARVAIDAANRVKIHAARARGIDAGTLRIATVRSAARRLLPPVLALFRISHPHVAVTLLEGSDVEVADLVRSGAAMLGLAAFAADGLAGTVVAEDGFVLVAPRGHALLARRPVPPAALHGAAFVMSSDGCEPLISTLLADEGALPDVRVRVADIATLLDLVREGVGVTVLPELALPGGDLLDLRTAAIRTARRRALLALEAAEQPRAASAAVFLDLLREESRRRAGRPRLAMSA